MASQRQLRQHDHSERREEEHIFVLGTGSVGKLIAHALRGIQDAPPISLLFHRPALIRELQNPTCNLTITTNKVPVTRGPFDAELVLPVRKPLDSVRSPALIDRDRIEGQYPAFVKNKSIHNLVVTVKAHQTVSALRPLVHRLSRDSTILFLQNGMGTLDEVNNKLFPDPETRPNYMLGINSHGVHATGPLAATHAGHGSIYLGVVPRPRSGTSTPSADNIVFAPQAKFLLRALTQVPVLAAVPIPPTALMIAQLEKLAVNCIINPLTVLLDGRNGDLLNNFALQRTWRLLLAEISLVVRNLPELRGVPNVDAKFSPDRLESIVVGVAQNTAENISSMLQDSRRGAETEIDYLNGYIVRRGEEMGIKAVMNYMLVQMVKGKQMMISKEVDRYTPFQRLSSPATNGKL